MDMTLMLGSKAVDTPVGPNARLVPDQGDLIPDPRI